MLDKTVESIIRTYTDDFTEEAVRLDTISPTPISLQNRNGHKLIESNVAQMFYAHMEGVALPPIILCRRNGRLFVIDGNHRVAMMREHNIEETTCYIANVDEETFQLWVNRANVHNGRDVASDADRLKMALSEVLSFGITSSKAAAIWAVEPDRLATEVRRARGSAKLTEAGIPKGKVSMSVKEKLADMEVEHIKILGQTVLENVTVDDFAAAKKDLISTPSRHRAEAAQQIKLTLTERRKASQGQANASNPYTSDKAKRAVKSVITGIKSNRAIVADPKVRKLVLELAAMFEAEQVRASA